MSSYPMRLLLVLVALSTGCGMDAAATRSRASTPREPVAQAEPPRNKPINLDFRHLTDSPEVVAKREDLASHLTPRAREVLTPSEIDDILKGSPKANNYANPDTMRRARAAMFKVADTDPRAVDAKRIANARVVELAVQLCDTDPSAETITSVVVQQAKPEIDALIHAWTTVYEENGWDERGDWNQLPALSQGATEGFKQKAMAAILFARQRSKLKGSTTP